MHIPKHLRWIGFPQLFYGNESMIVLILCSLSLDFAIIQYIFTVFAPDPLFLNFDCETVNVYVIEFYEFCQ